MLCNLELQIELQFLQDDVNATKDRYKKVMGCELKWGGWMFYPKFSLPVAGNDNTSELYLKNIHAISSVCVGRGDLWQFPLLSPSLYAPLKVPTGA